MEERTENNGIAVFRLSEPLPSQVQIHTGMGGNWRDCSPNDHPGFDVTEILASGVSREGYCGKFAKIDKSFNASPGEVYFFAVHLTFLERLKEPREGPLR
jgi:hypothetical protein